MLYFSLDYKLVLVEEGRNTPEAERLNKTNVNSQSLGNLRMLDSSPDTQKLKKGQINPVPPSPTYIAPKKNKNAQEKYRLTDEMEEGKFA